MAELCREFGISRKTGYKIFDRYQECGMQGLTDRSRRPYRYANRLPFQVENFILKVKHEHHALEQRHRVVRETSVQIRLLEHLLGLSRSMRSAVTAEEFRGTSTVCSFPCDQL